MILLSNGTGCKRQRENAKTELEGQLIPSFNLLLADGATTINTAAIPPGSPVVLMLFSPECSYCAELTDSITSNISALKGIRFYFISPFPMPGLQHFSRQYNLDKHTNVVVGMDYDNFYLLHTRTSVIPLAAVYDTQKRLKKVLAGQASARAIREIAYM
ncbi:MAG TPA: hypothetical protein VGR89_02860 [Puia sp.]|nr:hypothetical protein [Puia sp.]